MPLQRSQGPGASESMESISNLSDDTLSTVLLMAGGASAAALASSSSSWRARLTAPSWAADRLWRALSAARWGRLVEAGNEEEESTAGDKGASGGPRGPPGGGAGRRRQSHGSRPAAPVPRRARAAVERPKPGPRTSLWFRYYAHRVARWSAPASPLGLAQELYCREPWRLLACCVLCSRTSGGSAVRSAVAQFFEAYSTPSEVVEGDLSEMAAMLLPLGLNREYTIKRMAAGFVQPWETPTDLYGCGEFAAASHTVFCLGDWESVVRDKTADRNVRAYAYHCRRLAIGEDVADAADAAERAEAQRAKMERQKARARKPPRVRKALPPKNKRARATRSSPRLRGVAPTLLTAASKSAQRPVKRRLDPRSGSRVRRRVSSAS